MPGDMEKVTGGGLPDRSGGTGQKSGTLISPLQPAYRLCFSLVTLLCAYLYPCYCISRLYGMVGG